MVALAVIDTPAIEESTGMNLEEKVKWKKKRKEKRSQTENRLVWESCWGFDIAKLLVSSTCRRKRPLRRGCLHAPQCDPPPARQTWWLHSSSRRSKLVQELGLGSVLELELGLEVTWAQGWGQEKAVVLERVLGPAWVRESGQEKAAGWEPA
jgi:hypothetical protein